MSAKLGEWRQLLAGRSHQHTQILSQSTARAFLGWQAQETQRFGRGLKAATQTLDAINADRLAAFSPLDRRERDPRKIGQLALTPPATLARQAQRFIFQ
nr:hypothetical protein [Thermogemmatispora tikiterensis]